MGVALLVRVAYESTFEQGYTYRLAVERVLEGTLPELERPGGDAPGAPADGILVTPPFGPGGAEDAWGLGLSAAPRRAVLRFAGTPSPIEDVELFRPAPGSGLGAFLPPGVLLVGGRFLALTSLELVADGAAP